MSPLLDVSKVTVVESTEQAVQCLPRLLQYKELGLDTETTALSPRHGRIRLLQLGAEDGKTWVFDLDKVNVEVLRPVLEHGPVKIPFNGKFDAGFLWMLHQIMPAPMNDPMLVDQIIEGRRYAKSLADVCLRYLNETLSKELQRSDWSRELTRDQLMYAAGDAQAVRQVLQPMLVLIEQAGLKETMLLENRALPAVTWMEQNGIVLNWERWGGLAQKADVKAQEIRTKLDKLAFPYFVQSKGVQLDFGGGWKTLNWGSPPQVLKFLKALGMDLPSTEEWVLMEVADKNPIIPLILAYREVMKKSGSYGENWHKYLERGRIYTDWHQIGADTGRMSSSDPALQTVPREEEYRDCFEAEDGRVLIRGDYSQIELRFIAQVAKDPVLISLYQQGADVHKATAMTISGKTDPNSVTKDERQMAKPVNFGLGFGMGAAKLRLHSKYDYGVEISEAQATAIRAIWFQKYRGVRRWHNNIDTSTNESRTLIGRRRFVRPDAYTERLNTPIQGSAGDGLKYAMAEAWETAPDWLKRPGHGLVATIHDELDVEAPHSHAIEAQGWLRGVMQRGMSRVLTTVPVDVEFKPLSLIPEGW